MSELTFGKNKRLLSNRQFESVIKGGRRTSDGLLVVYAAANEGGSSRLGVSISKGCGGAVVRNRLKRLIREAFRLNQGRMPGGFDYVVLVSPGWTKKTEDAKSLTLSLITESLLPLAGRSVGNNRKV